MNTLNKQKSFVVKYNFNQYYLVGIPLGLLNICFLYNGLKYDSLVDILPIILSLNVLMGLIFIISFSFDFKKVRIEDNKISIFHPYRLFKKSYEINLNQVFHIDIRPGRGKGGYLVQIIEFYFQEDGYQTGKTKIALTTYKPDITRLTQYLRTEGIRVESDYD